MIKKILFTLTALICAGIVYGFQWPVEKVVIISTFGEKFYTQYLKGIELGSGSEEQEVRPIEDGEMVFFSVENDSPLVLPSGLGNYAVYQHKNGIRSLYGHLKGDSVFSSRTDVSVSDVIGITGSSGGAVGLELHLQVIDTEFDQYINPLLSLPFQEDNGDPVIGNIYLTDDDLKKSVTNNEVVDTGIFGLSADIRDFSSEEGSYSAVAPYMVSLFVNGENMANVVFESLKLGGKKMRLKDEDGPSADELYSGDWEIYLGDFELRPGDARIEIFVKDFSGNEKVKIINLKVAGRN